MALFRAQHRPAYAGAAIAPQGMPQSLHHLAGQLHQLTRRRALDHQRFRPARLSDCVRRKYPAIEHD